MCLYLYFCIHAGIMKLQTCHFVVWTEQRLQIFVIDREKKYHKKLFFLDNFVAPPLRLFLQEEGNRLSPSGFPWGPASVN